jgi:acyl-CoA reductase-like NAD-dependent aldehyde dehydrogenase
MKIAREEIFGPVLSIISYDTEDEAIEIANDTPFGLAGFVQSRDAARARKVADRIRAGRASISMGLRSTAACHSAATSSPAMDASSGCSDSKNIWR